MIRKRVVPAVDSPAILVIIKEQLSTKHRSLKWKKGGISVTYTEEYKEHIEYTFHAFCKVIIRNAMYTALRSTREKYPLINLTE